MTDEQLRKIYHKAKRYAVRMGFHNDAEDIAQWVLIEFIERNHGQTCYQAYIDVLRKRFSGRVGDRGYKSRKALTGLSSSVHEGSTPAPPPDSFDSLISSLTPKQQTVLSLYFKWGLSMKAIGLLFGLTESAICHQVKKATKQLRSEITLDCAP